MLPERTPWQVPARLTHSNAGLSFPKEGAGKYKFYACSQRPGFIARPNMRSYKGTEDTTTERSCDLPCFNRSLRLLHTEMQLHAGEVLIINCVVSRLLIDKCPKRFA